MGLLGKGVERQQRLMKAFAHILEEEEEEELSAAKLSRNETKMVLRAIRVNFQTRKILERKELFSDKGSLGLLPGEKNKKKKLGLLASPVLSTIQLPFTCI